METSHPGFYINIREKYLAEAKGNDHDPVYLERWRELEERWPRIEAGELPGPVYFDVLVRFDAMNDYGVPVRHGAICSVFDEFGKKPSTPPPASMMLVDGKNYYDWVRAGMK